MELKLQVGCNKLLEIQKCIATNQQRAWAMPTPYVRHSYSCKKKSAMSKARVLTGKRLPHQHQLS